MKDVGTEQLQCLKAMEKGKVFGEVANKMSGKHFLLEIDDSELRKRVEKKIFENMEDGIRHNAYDQEFRELYAVEHGDLELLESSIAELEEELIGVLSPDPLRNQKNLGIVLVTNTSRAAIRGGLNAEIAFSMSDLYVQQIEECQSIGMPLQLARSAEFRFTRMVRENLNNGLKDYSDVINEHVSNCKNYICSNLHMKLEVRGIASAIRIDPDYLSRIFHKTEGMTISEYILKKKVILVKNLLTYSDYSYSEIAAYLGFSSQSYLGARFKQETGYTLRGYRMKFRKREFFTGSDSNEGSL